jgi:hypothetical protein
MAGPDRLSLVLAAIWCHYGTTLALSSVTPSTTASDLIAPEQSAIGSNPIRCFSRTHACVYPHVATLRVSGEIVPRRPPPVHLTALLYCLGRVSERDGGISDCALPPFGHLSVTYASGMRGSVSGEPLDRPSWSWEGAQGSALGCDHGSSVTFGPVEGVATAAHLQAGGAFGRGR